MKTKLFSIPVLLLISLISIYFKSPDYDSYNKKKSLENTLITSSDTLPFIIGAYDLGNLKDYKKIDSLRFNGWHWYLTKGSWSTILQKNVPLGWYLNDTLLGNPNLVDSVKLLLDSNNLHGLQMFMQRPATVWLCYGQQSDYQFEEQLSNNELSFYSYKIHPDTVSSDYQETYINGEEIRGRVCSLYTNKAGYVATGLIANREQVNFDNRHYPGNGDYEREWYIKPRIKIDTADAIANKNVCRIEVFNYRDSLIKSIEIKGENFIDEYYIFRGPYLDWFYRLPPESQIIDISLIFNPYKDDWMNKESCKVDFRIYWYGECNMWVDRIRVEDDRAYNLFDSTALHYICYHQMIDNEAYLAATNTSPARFYLDEFEFNHIPCIKYVSRKLKEKTIQYGKEVPFTVYNGMGFYGAHTQEGWLDFNPFQKYFLDSVNIREYNYGSYPFAYRDPDLRTKIPNTLPRTSGNGVYGDVVEPDTYEEWLQNYIFYKNQGDPKSGEYMELLNEVRNRCTSSNGKLNFITPVQTHIMKNEDFLREPTNEELAMTTYLPVSYGSRGVLFYGYDAYGSMDLTGDKYFAGLASLLDTNPITLGPRYINVYNQHKWEKVKEITRTLNKWKPYLESFELKKTHSYNYSDLSDRNSFISSTYFHKIISFKPGSGIPTCDEPDNIPQGMTYDCPEDTYIQAAIFSDNKPNTKYYMILNRRCSPDSTSVNGRRYLRILMDENSTEFFGFNNWKITDLYNDSTVGVFDKRNYSSVNLGWFMPGEGKLYKISPVMIDGGILVTDEELENMEFNCDSIVNGNNKSITLKDKVTINFSSHGGINLEGGQFSTGTTASSKQIILRGQNGVK
ncbi:MAG: hypothetical protein FJ216_09915, partial [Ignavibacteria bacterium]|nr:hypothetical protein [Ignavibacteria bacterium]